MKYKVKYEEMEYEGLPAPYDWEAMQRCDDLYREFKASDGTG